MEDETRISRRASLLKLGGLLAGAAAVGGWRVAEGEAGRKGRPQSRSGLVTCVLAPEPTEGPFYLDDQKLRRNITRGPAGRAAHAAPGGARRPTCRPIKGAIRRHLALRCRRRILGDVRGRRREFLRGMQRTDAKGVATFRTIYPGWYPGRTVHVHVMVHVGGNVVHTGQLYFPDALTDTVYRRAPYNRRPGRSTRNAADSVYGTAGGARRCGSRRAVRATSARSRWASSARSG